VWDRSVSSERERGRVRGVRAGVAARAVLLGCLLALLSGCASTEVGCDEVAGHVVGLTLEADDARALPDDVRGRLEAHRGELEEQVLAACAGWSREIRACKRAAADVAALEVCDARDR
jgi:hypothetical protein